MKKLGTQIVKLLVIALAINMFFACSKDEDDETPKPYAGNWETEVYDALSMVDGSPVKQKMDITLTNTTFTDIMYQGPTADAMIELIGIKGDVEDMGQDTLSIEINDLSVSGSPYINKIANPTEFAAAYALSIGMMLDEEFKATYTIEGNTMEFIIPIKMGDITVPDTLNLTRK